MFAALRVKYADAIETAHRFAQQMADKAAGKDET